MYATGGSFTPSEGLTNGTAGAAAALNPLVDIFDQGNSYGRQSGLATGLKQGASMAAAGAALGPIGAIAGGAIGLGAGLIGSIGAKKKEQALEFSNAQGMQRSQLRIGEAKLASDPSLIYGNKSATMYKNGGPLKGGPGDPKPKMLDEVNISAPRLAPVKYPFGKRGETMSQEEWDYVRTKRGYPDVYADKRRGTDNFIPGEIYSNEVRNSIKEYRTANPKKMVNGGSLMDSYQQDNQLKPLNKQTVEVNGPSHANGGVQIPGAEVEGGETISNGFVFSEQLGFAKLHKPIAKAIGKLEDKPLTAVRRKTMQALKSREQALSMAQEFMKQQMGIS